MRKLLNIYTLLALAILMGSWNAMASPLENEYFHEPYVDFGDGSYHPETLYEFKDGNLNVYSVQREGVELSVSPYTVTGEMLNVGQEVRVLKCPATVNMDEERAPFSVKFGRNGGDLVLHTGAAPIVLTQAAPEQIKKVMLDTPRCPENN